MSRFVTIAGATGNIGKALALHLLGRGVRVRAVARRAEGLAPRTAQSATPTTLERFAREVFAPAFKAA